MKVTQHYIEQLIANNVPESIDLDYKAESYNLLKDNDKSEFLKDICGFANSRGGIVVLGIEEQKDENGKNTGLPLYNGGLTKVLNADQYAQQLINIASSSITPKLNLSVSCFSYMDGQIIVIEIPDSPQKPFLINKAFDYIRVRNSAGIQTLDYSGLSHMVLKKDLYQNKVDEFLEKRITSFQKKAAFPIGSFFRDNMCYLTIFAIPDRNIHLDVSSFRINNTQIFGHKNDNTNEMRYTSEGAFIQDGLQSYRRFFRDGKIESTCAINFLKEGTEFRIDKLTHLIINEISVIMENVNETNEFSPVSNFNLYLNLSAISGLTLVMSPDRYVYNKGATTEPRLLTEGSLFTKDQDQKTQIDSSKFLMDQIWQAFGHSGAKYMPTIKDLKK